MENTIWMPLIGIATKLVLALLVGLSVWSMAIMLDRKKVMKHLGADGELEALKKEILANTATPPSPKENLTLLRRSYALLREAPQNPEAIAYALKSSLTDERARYSRGLSFLATLGSNAPFVGLFGTVLGIIQSFGTLAGGSGDMNQVILKLAEALIATAVGLFVAIPAVTAYNLFSQKLKSAFLETDSLRDFYLAHRIFSEKR
jgi:biopolymer transport protein ExbB/TolQ